MASRESKKRQVKAGGGKNSELVAILTKVVILQLTAEASVNKSTSS
jgi:hypothetical protein